MPNGSNRGKEDHLQSHYYKVVNILILIITERYLVCYNCFLMKIPFFNSDQANLYISLQNISIFHVAHIHIYIFYIFFMQIEESFVKISNFWSFHRFTCFEITWTQFDYFIAANLQNQKLGLLKWKIQNLRPKIETKTYSVYLNATY